MANPTWAPGAFVWRELMCAAEDVQKAKGFYGELFGWKYQEMPMGPMTYTMIAVGENTIGGVAPYPPNMKAPTAWLSAISVENVDECATQAKANGGKVVMEPMDVPNIGRYAVLADAGGAHFSVYRSLSGDPDPKARPGLGAFCWETLMTDDIERAKKFYGAVIGWTANAGPGGAPVFQHGEVQSADVQKCPPGVPSHFLTYVIVEDLAKANARVEKLGGKVAMAKIDVPTVGSVSVVSDTVGAHFGLFQPLMG